MTKMANEKRLIDANALEEAITTDFWEHYTQCHDTDQIALIDMVREDIGNAPTVDAVEVVHGRWIEHEWAEEENGLLVSNYECSVCHSWERDEGYYCPKCGAKMDGGNEVG